MNSVQKKIIIVGGGFAGVTCALSLEKARLPGHKIILISDSTHFEYHPALYRVVTGRSPLEVCIPLSEIFEGKDVEIVRDKITSIDLESKRLCGESQCDFTYDILILALGSETDFMGIPGLKEHSYGFKSIQQALRLKRHLHEVFTNIALSHDKSEKITGAHIIVVGAGASGVEAAGELAVYTQKMAKMHNVDPQMVTIDLIEAAGRILPFLPLESSKAVERRLRELCVNIYVNRTVMKEEVEEVYLADMKMKAKTVIWTAGVRANGLYAKTYGFVLNKKGQVEVDKFLQAKGFEDVYILGDGAATKFSGMAQTACFDARFVAKEIINRSKHVESNEFYVPKRPFVVIPVGPAWACMTYEKLYISGIIAFCIRRIADFKFFMSILTIKKALIAFSEGRRLSETCSTCGSL